MLDNKLIQNAIKTHDGVIIASMYTHNYVSYGDYMVDGGLDYSRYSYPEEHKDEIEFLFLYEKDTFEKKKNNLIWGTRGKDGKSELKWVKLIDCDTNHLINIKRINLPKLYVDVIDEIIYERRVNKLKKI